MNKNDNAATTPRRTRASDVLVAFGGKATFTKAAAGEASVAPRADGYLVRYTTADDPDITSLRDFFTNETYFGEAKSLPIYFHHGLPIEVKSANGTLKTYGPGKVRIGVGSIKSDETGIFIDAILDEAGEYQEAVQQLLEDGMLGWSSGSASHLVVREAILDDSGAAKAHNIKQWLLAEASLTHTPAEPRNVASSIKSLLETYGQAEWEKEWGEEAQWDAGEAIGCAAASVVMWRLEKAVDNILGDEDLDPAGQVAALEGVFDEAKLLMSRVANALVVVAPDNTEDAVMMAAKSAFLKYVPAGQLPAKKNAGPAAAGLSLNEQGQQALDAVIAYTKRATSVHSMRARSGRTLSASHTDIANKAIEALQPLTGEGLTGDAAPAKPAAAAVPATVPAENADAAKNAATPPTPDATEKDAPSPPAAADAAASETKSLETLIEQARKLGVAL